MDSSLISEHPKEGSTVLPILKSFLPNALPLYRRLQFPYRSSSSHVLTSFARGTPLEDIPTCFCAAYVDRSRRPETEVWVFLSGEVKDRCPIIASQEKGEHCPDCTRALISIISYIGTLPLPESVHGNDIAIRAPSALEEQHTSKPTTYDYSSHLVDNNLILFGSTAALPVSILNAHNLIRADLPGLDFEYQKYIFHTGQLRSLTEPDLPSGLRWGSVREQDFALVKSRTQIPRKDKTLAILPSVAIFPTNQDTPDAPIAWCFLGPDGSLASLHVEPEWRGRGLAKTAAKKIWADKSSVFNEEEDKREEGWLAHSDVHVDNHESKGVARSLGGVEGWTVWWIRVDLSLLNDK